MDSFGPRVASFGLVAQCFSGLGDGMRGSRLHGNDGEEYAGVANY